MKFPISYIVVFVTVLNVCSALLGLPVVNFQPCDARNPNFQECWQQSVQAFMRTFGNPVPLVGNIFGGIFEPYRIERVSIGPGRDQFNVQLIINNVESSGWYKTEIDNVTLNLPTHTFIMRARAPLIRMKGQYNADGRILGRVFRGQGASAIILENVGYQMKFVMQPYKRLGVDYWRVLDSTLILDPERVRFEFENQPQELVDEINQRWREVFDDAKTDFESAIFAPFDKMIRLMLDVAPIQVFVLNFGQNLPLNPLNSLGQSPFGQAPKVPFFSGL